MTDSIWELPDGINEHYYARYPLQNAKPEGEERESLEFEGDSLPDPRQRGERRAREKELAEVLRTSTSDERQRWQDLVETLRVRRRELLRIPGVTAVDVGYRVRDHKFKDELVL